MLTIINLPFCVCSLRSRITFSVSADDSPDVGSSRNSTAGSRISSRAMLRRLRCPPEIYLLIAEPTLRSFAASSPRSFNVCRTRWSISSSDIPSKHNLAVNQRFWYTVSSSISRSSCGTNPIRSLACGSAISWPLMVIVPSWGFRLPLSSDNKVVLPVPEPPMIASNSPFCSVKLRLCMPLSLLGNLKVMLRPQNSTLLLSFSLPLSLYRLTMVE